MRISDWSSDVCSSDLLHPAPAVTQGDGDGALGIVLADDVAVEFVDDFAGSHGHSIWRSSSKNEPMAYSARSCSSMVWVWLVKTQMSPAMPSAVSRISREIGSASCRERVGH